MLATLCLLVWFYQDTAPKPFEPLTQAEWNLKVDPDKNIEDAIFIQDWTIFSSNRIERYIKVRVLSESGKAAAAFQDDSKGVNDLKGQVTLRDGTVIPFKQKSDMVEALAYKKRYEKKKSKFLVPPGLNDDCIVEMSWYVPVSQGLPEDTNELRILIAGDYYCQKRIFVVPQMLSDSEDDSITRIVWSGTDAVQFNRKEKSGKTILTYENVQALVDYPFGNKYLDSKVPMLLAFRTGRMASGEMEGYWKGYGRNFMADRLRMRGSKSSQYKAWVSEVKKNLPKEPAAALLYAHEAFRKYFSSLEFCSDAKKSEYKPPQENASLPMLIGHYFENANGNSHMLTFVYTMFLDDLDIKAKFLMTTNCYGPPFRPAELQVESLRWYQPFVGVEENGKWTYVSPTDLEYDAGFVPYNMRGGTAAIIDPDKSFKIEFGSIPRSSAGDNQNTIVTQMVLSADGKLHVKVQEGGTGEFNASQRRTYYPLNPVERKERLTRRARSLMSNFEIKEVAVYGADSVSEAVKTVMLGSRELDLANSTHFSLDPFPGSPLPFNLPNWWPKDRTQMILLPYAQAINEECKIQVPPGFKLEGNPSWIKKNTIGGVQVEAVQEGSTIVVRRFVVIARDLFSPQEEPLLKSFLAWVEEAHMQTIRISKGGKS